MSDEAKRIINDHDKGEGSFSSVQMYEAYTAGEALGYQKGRAYERRRIMRIIESKKRESVILEDGSTEVKTAYPTVSFLAIESEILEPPGDY